ncbi:MAG: Flp pilus assembly protein CpaB [Candidatus Omnitrophica bacterium]|nr:Flp pilus assembly protein CpaB [Candidatus Omnitrophota bacterium]
MKDIGGIKRKIEGVLPAKQKLIIISVAILSGLLATLLVNVYIEDKIVDVSGGKLVPVIFAGTNITKNTPIAENMLQIKNVPEAYLGFDAITERYQKFLIGQRTLESVKKDQAILWSNIMLQDERHLANKLNVNQRAISIAVDEVTGISGLIRPGDSVDIIGYFNVPGQDYSGIKPVVKVLMQDALVLAVGSNVTGTSEAFEMASMRSGASEIKKTFYDEAYKTVTLRVSPRDANILTFAAEQGKLLFILRRKGDVFINNLKDVEYKDIFELWDYEPLADTGSSEVQGYPAVYDKGEDAGSAYFPSSDFLGKEKDTLPQNMKELKDKREEYEAIIDEVSKDSKSKI